MTCIEKRFGLWANGACQFWPNKTDHTSVCTVPINAGNPGWHCHTDAGLDVQGIDVINEVQLGSCSSRAEILVQDKMFW